MKAATLAAIRAEATTEQDALECVNAILCNFKPNAGAGDALLTCAMDIEAFIEYGPEDEVQPRFEERQYDRFTQLQATL